MENDILGCFYLHVNGQLIYKPFVVFANDPDYFKSPFVVHAWVLKIQPPVSERKGQLKWLLKDFLEEAYKKGALKSEILRILESLRVSEQFGGLFKDKTSDSILQLIVNNKLDIFFNEEIKE